MEAGTALIPIGTWMLAAFLCLALEAAGTPIGARKLGFRSHLVVVVVLAAIGAAAATLALDPSTAAPFGLRVDRLGILAALSGALVAAAIALANARSADMGHTQPGERYFFWSLLLAGMTITVFAADVSAALVGLAVVAVAAAVAAALESTSFGIEAAAKGIAGFSLLWIIAVVAVWLAYAQSGNQSVSALFAGNGVAIVAAALWLVVCAALLGAIPLHSIGIDFNHGASSVAGVWAPVALLIGGVLAAHAGVLPHPLAVAASVVAIITAVAAPLSALDGTRIRRIVAHLALVPGSWVLAAIAISAPGEVHAWPLAAGALALAAAWVGIAVPGRDGAATWEDWSGFGRQRPVEAAIVVYALASIAGLPGTAGFVARLEVARACFASGNMWLGVVTLAGFALGAAPVVRLALFWFVKAPRRLAPEPELERRIVLFVLVGLQVALSIWPRAFDAWFASL